MISLTTQIEQAPRIHPRIVRPLKRLGIHTLRDLLFHFPSRYQEFSDAKPITEIEKGAQVTIEGVLEKLSQGRTAHKHLHLVQARVRDASGNIKVIWFGQPFLARTLREGALYRFSGKATLGPAGLSLQNPAYERIQAVGSDLRGVHTGGLVAVYPETEGITSRWIRFLIKSLLPLAASLEDPLPTSLRDAHGLPELSPALSYIHFPSSLEEVKIAEKRFAFQELLLLQLRAMRERSRLKQASAPAIEADAALLKRFAASLPFALTNAQRRSIWEIANDMAKGKPMNRLLEGDVGSGKTLVAAAAALLASRQNVRVAFMAPTEILALQHFDSLTRVLSPFGVGISLLTAAHKRTHPGHSVIVGTHALIQKGVAFENLGLIIVDEQHRFGVNQRAALVRGHTRTETTRNNVDKTPLRPKADPPWASTPHFLSMSATPIPRTIALTLYGDLDLSLLDEMPHGRLPVRTKVVRSAERKKIYEFIRQKIAKGEQAFVVCPRIDSIADLRGSIQRESASSQRQSALVFAEMKAVKEEHKRLAEEIFPEFRVDILHGKMKPKEKEKVLNDFRNRTTHILVSTSVIEVGVDIPNATIMLIEGAERFGLATLHQFRGRVGRGNTQAYCFLLPTDDAEPARRLAVLEETTDGFALAERDLEIRGPGDIFGTEQWGASPILLMALKNRNLVREVRATAIQIAKESPDLSAYPTLRQELAILEATHHLE